jgi:hypothetical protein
MYPRSQPADIASGLAPRNSVSSNHLAAEQVARRDGVTKLIRSPRGRPGRTSEVTGLLRCGTASRTAFFVAKRVQPRSEGEIDVVGELSLKGITREVVLRVEQHGQAKDPWGNVRAAFTAKTSIDRKDFGLTWNQVLETGGVMVGDRVDIEADVEAVKQVEAQVA